MSWGRETTSGSMHKKVVTMVLPGERNWMARERDEAYF